MAPTWFFDNLDTPIFSAMRCTLRVLVPVVYISATPATSVQSARRYRSITSSGKKLPVLSFGYPECERVHAGRERPLAVAVPAIGPSAAESLGLRVHHGVDHLFGEPTEQFPHIDRPVVEPRHAEHVGRGVC